MTAIPAPLPLDSEQHQPGALEIRNLNKSYRIDGQALPVLQNIDLQVLPGEFLSIVGASGCGKSTLLRLIVGLEDDFDGQIRVDGESVSGTSLERGIVFQDHRLFPWKTVEQNILLALKNSRLGKREKAERVAEHLERVGLGGFEQAYPHQLSGGMAQRAAIARALVTQPKVLLLDEPFGALDALTRIRLQHELQRIWVQQRSTMIMVTHDVEEALYLGDRVIVMDPRPGRIRHVVEVGLPHPRDRQSPRLHKLRDELLLELTGQDAL
ncbi:ABC transporter ATP-binding protein [Stutzerimonas kirkiae]|uniref:Sulfonate ABC transporter ATP-binding protein n=1 Tax=Stutzerimonas kirkiae TaxID=2211392 RepID=A0A4Q9REG5_9GAMM|nr:ABC transporter ATP-binding protein [Stutzerimonas kirkiae]TBU99209.1 sulfonate ABC transporter ATP-binding protein [Stutzerimonas kirkiae]TBV06331.1 sulfonate ABC transporter ATP-binding protein [Stutzerimonas kirkiae]TBV07537.1 sulfonate ABC transporter ATP-binding protein [Stutzerimonas kirkiae]